MTLQQLEYFRVMSRVLHYTKAAEMLYISQPSLSYAMSELENELGVSLFTRKGNHTILTPEGIEFSHYVDKALDTLVAGKEAVELKSIPSDVLSVAYLDEIGCDFIPDLIKDFHIKNPHVSFQLYHYHHTLLVPKLMEGDFDLGFAIETDVPTVRAIPLLQQDMVLLVPPDHRLATRTSVSLTEISSEPMIITSEGTMTRRIIDSMCAEAKVQLNLVSEPREYHSAAILVKAGLGLTILPRTPLNHNYGLCEIPIVYPVRPRTVYLLFPGDRIMTPVAKRFLTFTLERFGQEGAIGV